MVVTNNQIERPPSDVLDAFWEFGTATVSSALREVCGILRASMVGPVAFTPGKKAVGTAVTLQFLPKREDIESGRQEEEIESRLALWDAVIAAQEGDVLVVDARANLQTGVLGEMLMTGIHAKGVKGLVVDGCVRDTPLAKDIGLPLFLKGATPHNATHFEMYPWSYNIPIGCGDVLVLPGDIVVGDDMGVVVVPGEMAAEVLDRAEAKQRGESNVREILATGADVGEVFKEHGIL